MTEVRTPNGTLGFSRLSLCLSMPNYCYLLLRIFENPFPTDFFSLIILYQIFLQAYMYQGNPRHSVFTFMLTSVLVFFFIFVFLACFLQFFHSSFLLSHLLVMRIPSLTGDILLRLPCMFFFMSDISVAFQTRSQALCEFQTLFMLNGTQNHIRVDTSRFTVRSEGQRRTYPGHQVARMATFCTVSPNLCGSSVWNVPLDAVSSGRNLTTFRLTPLPPSSW